MRRALAWLALAPVVGACGSSSSVAPPDSGAGDDAGLEAGAEAGACTTPPCPTTKIEHLVVIVQENHTFDAYFGRWCTAAPGSSPSCTQGPGCCEAGPAKDPGSSATPLVLDDARNEMRDPDHTQACELSETDGGKMDDYVTASCGGPGNLAYADAATVQLYWSLAQTGALADHWFQPVAGQSSSNEMYFARAQFVFLDNTVAPKGAVGQVCNVGGTPGQYGDTTIADLLEKAGVGWAYYAQGYATMKAAAAQGACPTTAPPDCAFGNTTIDCIYDPADDPFSYYPKLRDDPAHFKDYADLATDLAGGKLPAVSFVKPIGYKSEHPGYENKITDGESFVTSTVDAITRSAFGPSTLVLVTWDEGGGFFDHVAPPPASAVDHQPYGTRVPTIALGPFARAGTISHTVMEHSSVVKFIEYNWLGGKTGQLGGRDGSGPGTAANIGSLLDPSLGVPEK